MKVYVVVGCHSISCEVYASLSKYGVKSTLEEAQKELKIIKQEIINEYEENDLNADNLNIKETDTTLTIVYENDDFESYTIYEKEVDYEGV